MTKTAESLVQTAASFFSHINPHTVSAPHPASLLPRLAESPGWCAMPAEGHDAHSKSPQRWVSLGGERARAASASHWESALELKGTFLKRAE